MLLREHLDNISARAATLQERHGLQLALGEIPDEIPVDVLLQWDRTLTDLRGSHFARRLRLFQYARETQTENGSGIQHLWTTIFKEILTAASWNPEGLQSHVMDPKHPVPFEELLGPFVSHVAAELNQLSHFTQMLTPEAQTEHLRNLLRKLSYVSSRCFYQAFDALRRQGGPGYAQFTKTWLAGGYVAFFTEYAALARLMTTICTQWISATRTFLSRFSADKAILEQHFSQGLETGPLVRIASGITAMHSDDGEVYRLTFASGLRLLYKPRSAETDLALAQIVDWLNTTGDLIPMCAVPVLHRAEYSWHGYIRHRTCGTIEEVRNYYHRIGQLAGLLQVLGSTDYHFDNLRADGMHPYLVDNETLFSPLLRISPDHTYTGDPLLDSGLLNSIARSLFLSDTRNMFFPHAPGISGVFARKDTYLWTRYNYVNTDRMRERQGSVQRTGRNIPRLGRRKVRPEEYLREIQQGYTAILRHIHDKKQDFIEVVDRATHQFSIQVRLLIRPTAAYEQIMHESLAPEYLRDGQTRSVLFEHMALLYTQSRNMKGAATYLRQETGMLEQFLVPAFSTPADMRPSHKKNSITRHARQVFDDNIRMLSDAFIRSQHEYMATHFYHGESFTGHIKKESRPVKDVLALCARFIRVYTHFYPITQLQGDPACIRDAYSMEGGPAGVLLLHAALQRVAPECQVPSAERLLEPLVQDCDKEFVQIISNPDGGLVKGKGSVIWLLTLLSEISGDAMFSELAKTLAVRLKVNTSDPEDLSYASGNAGLLLSLIRLSDHHRDTDVEHFIDKLTESMIRSYTEPPTGEVHGLFDGTEGTLYALSACHLRYPRPSLQECLMSAQHRLEDYWRTPVHLSNARHTTRVSLQAGLSGWFLTDAAVGHVLGTNPVRHETHRLRSLVMLRRHDTDTVTHGIAGRAECILQTGDDSLQKEFLSAWLGRYERTGFYQLHPHYLHPGFFSGVSGILYQQLRLLFPGALPSALGLL